MHSIHEIVVHLTRWLTLASGALHGQAIPRWPYPDDWPSAGDTAWDRALGNLKQATEQLAGYTLRIAESRLEEQAPGRTYTIAVLLPGVIRHAAYHGGQIALLKKLTRV